MTPEEIRAHADECAPRVNPDWTINTFHVAVEQTLREKHGHPRFIDALDGPGRYRPTIAAAELTEKHLGLHVLVDVPGADPAVLVAVGQLPGFPPPDGAPEVAIVLGYDGLVYGCWLRPESRVTLTP